MSIRNAGLGREQQRLHGGRTGLDPLVVKPREAWVMLGCGNTWGYELLAAGELESYLDGRSRKITVASIHAYIARRLAAKGATGGTAQRSSAETATGS
jgi:excisionase family DNA binding protein